MQWIFLAISIISMTTRIVYNNLILCSMKITYPGNSILISWNQKYLRLWFQLALLKSAKRFHPFISGIKYCWYSVETPLYFGLNEGIFLIILWECAENSSVTGLKFRLQISLYEFQLIVIIIWSYMLSRFNKMKTQCWVWYWY